MRRVSTLNSMIIRNMRRERLYQVIMTDLYRIGVLEASEVDSLLGYTPGKKVTTTPATDDATTTDDAEEEEDTVSEETLDANSIEEAAIEEGE